MHGSQTIIKHSFTRTTISSVRSPDMTEPHTTSFCKPANDPGRLKRKRPHDDQHGTTAATDKRTNTLHFKDFNLPIKDPSRHTSGRVRDQQYLQLCTSPHDDRAHDAFKAKILEEDIQREAEVDKWLVQFTSVWTVIGFPSGQLLRKFWNSVIGARLLSSSSSGLWGREPSFPTQAPLILSLALRQSS
jgi:hypothetical protein